ncbi:MAG: ADP-ribosylglycohydrolase family protein [Clostridiales bacterium]|nr:ADP-ribosylglycohydrolase family protein [Clostridiales bacterium]
MKRKILGCYNGKNIGGALGAPFEFRRGVLNVGFFTDEVLKNPPANDDLDLQLVWLCAVEYYGKFVDSNILAEFWLTYIVPEWFEYGTGKGNLRAGLRPPLSGALDNPFGNSNGAFIRSEIWACLAPGNPAIAAAYAYEDAVVDHAGEGLNGAVFCAALQSAAFVENDRDKLIDAALSYIPADSLVARAVGLVRQAYKNNLTFAEARDKLMREIPGNFGIISTPYAGMEGGYPVAEPGMDAPNNIGIMLIGWLYGENDFGKSICTAVNCGEDADCTAATLGALLGILNGNDSIPKKWQEPIDGKITTMCVNATDMVRVPKDVEELTLRILKVIPAFLNKQSKCSELCDLSYKDDKYCVYTAQSLKKEPDFPAPAGLDYGTLALKPRINELMKYGPYAALYSFPTFNAVLDYGSEPSISEGETKAVRLRLFFNKISRTQKRFDVKLYADETVAFPKGRAFNKMAQTLYQAAAEFEFEIRADQIRENRVEIIVDISVPGRHTNEMIKIRYFAK